MQESKRYEILVAALGRHEVTMTNPKIGTVQVSRRGYYMFRKLVAKRGIVAKSDTQSDVLCELGACFEAARRLPNRDRNGNLMLLDKDTEIMFVIADEGRVLLASFDQREGRKKNRARKRAEAQAQEKTGEPLRAP